MNAFIIVLLTIIALATIGFAAYKLNIALYKPQNIWNVAVFKMDKDEDKLGGHHFNSVIFNNKRVVVMDGLMKDSWINNRTRGLYRK